MLALEGTLDLATSPQAAQALQDFMAAHGPSIIVDASRLDFIDSKGVGTLLGAAKAARDAKGCLFLHDPALPVRKILEMCGLTSLFPPPQEPQTPESQEPPSEPARPTGRTAPRVARRAA